MESKCYFFGHLPLQRTSCAHLSIFWYNLLFNKITCTLRFSLCLINSSAEVIFVFTSIYKYIFPMNLLGTISIICYWSSQYWMNDGIFLASFHLIQRKLEDILKINNVISKWVDYRCSSHCILAIKYIRLFFLKLIIKV